MRMAHNFFLIPCTKVLVVTLKLVTALDLISVLVWMDTGALTVLRDVLARMESVMTVRTANNNNDDNDANS